MNNMKLTLLFLIALTSFYGCSSRDPYIREPASNQHSIVFGYIDMDSAMTDIDWISAKKIKPKVKKPYYFFSVDDGMFYSSFIVPGTYMFASFGGSSFWKRMSASYNFPEQGRKEMDLSVKKQGLYYVGSYRFKTTDKGWFKEDEYDVVRTKRPTEKELLVRLLEKVKSDFWRKKINARIKRLK